MLETIDAMRRPSRAMLRPRIRHLETSAMLRASRREAVGKNQSPVQIS